MELAFRDSHIVITRQELDALYKRWESIEPIITLMARYKGNPFWHNEIPVLARVVKSILSDRFASLKYEGDPKDLIDQQKAREQLKMLKSQKAVKAWRKNRAKIDLYDPSVEEPSSGANLVNNAQIIIQTNVIPHLRSRTEGPILEGAAKEKLLELLRLDNKNIPGPRALAKETGSDVATVERTLLRLLIESSESNSIEKIAKYLRGNATLFHYEAITVVDLSSVLTALTPQKKGAPVVIFTTTFDGPKMLWKIGDLVDTSSCQNYQTGTHIETLPGYVMDAGVKGMASVVLKSNHFAEPSEYTALIEAFRAKARDEPVEINSGLDADKEVVHIRILRRGQAIQTLKTIPIRKWQMRVVLKLGETKTGQPGFAVERPYEQPHWARSLMIRHIQQITNETADAIGGIVGEEITIPESRNDGGVYSDAAHGIQTGPYTIKAQGLPQ